MAYESMTYEVIFHRMMERVKSVYPNLDTREGSILFNALAPAAIELAILYSQVDNAINESCTITATREFLILRCHEMGIDTSVFEASAGVHKGEFNVEVPIGSRWNCDLFNYTILEAIGLNSETGRYEYRMECETTGTEPNNHTGDLIAITDMPSNLSHAKLIECLIEGENETPDEDVRQYYYDYVNDVATDCNVAQYKRWCADYEGIGNYRIIPLWKGSNTVKVSILNASNTPATDDLINEFQEYLDPGITGMGDGIAPIGAFVTVSTASEKPINVSAVVKMKDGHNDLTVIDKALDEYFKDIAYETQTVAYMKVGAAILAVEGVEFVTDLKLNGGTDNIALGQEEIATLGTTQWTESV